MCWASSQPWGVGASLWVGADSAVTHPASSLWGRGFPSPHQLHWRGLARRGAVQMCLVGCGTPSLPSLGLPDCWWLAEKRRPWWTTPYCSLGKMNETKPALVEDSQCLRALLWLTQGRVLTSRSPVCSPDPCGTAPRFCLSPVLADFLSCASDGPTLGQLVFPIFIFCAFAYCLDLLFFPVLSKRQCICHWLGRRYLQAV